MLIHVVSHGERLWQIANQYHVNINTIQQVNQLPNPNQLLIGQAIVIPVSGELHTIQVGENLWTISSNYGVSVNANFEIQKNYSTAEF